MTQNGTVQPVFPSQIMPNQVYTPGSSALDIFVAPTRVTIFWGNKPGIASPATYYFCIRRSGSTEVRSREIIEQNRLPEQAVCHTRRTRKIT